MAEVFRFSWRLIFVVVTGLGVASAGAASVDTVREAPTVMNIVNFVRGSEPRNPKLDLVLPLREEIAQAAGRQGLLRGLVL